MIFDSLKSENCFFVLVDFQEKFFPLIKKKYVKQARSNMLMMIKMFKELHIPMLGTDHCRSALGITDAEVLKEWNGPDFKDKVTFSCLGCDDFLKDLATVGNRKIAIVAGLVTQICVLQTTLDLIRKGYTPIVIKDACLSSTTLKWENGLELMKDNGAIIMNFETVMFYLLQRAKTPEFKVLTKLLKEAAVEEHKD